MNTAVRIFAALLLLFLLLPCAVAEQDAQPQARDITSACNIRVTDGDAGGMLDAKINTDWEYSGSDASVGVEIAANETAGGLLVYWDMEPTAYEIILYDAQGSEIGRSDQNDTFPCIVGYYPLTADTRRALLHVTAPGQGIAELRVCSAGALPDSAQLWRAPVEKAELMVVSAHQDDEVLWFGGTIPYYAVAQDRPTVVVYMANCGRRRRGEALDGLWAMGVRNYPDFINLKDKNLESMEESVDLWGGRENIVSVLVERIRRYKPEVIVTHDLNGEYGHNQHKLTAAAMEYAITAAADANQFADSAARYGAWQVKKLYIHLYDQNTVYMDWKTPMEAFGGRSPLDMARVGYAKHVSQQEFYQVSDGGQYDNAAFGLYYTTVGADTGRNDFFENIDAPAATETPIPTAVPTAAPTAIPAAPVPTVEPAVTAAPAIANEKSGASPLWWILPGIAAVGVGAGFVLARRAKRRHKRRRRRIR